ncbi:MAG TPA: type I-F CRISPR-associated protein Csy2 [Vitreoscilla sp.]|nr:type I-F CRISPR-associated protein Csy2 [Vitreoscilla sp.]
MRPFLLIPHIRIHNANAMSSPYSIGFPAMTAWLGAVHALQRKLQQLPDFENLCLSKVGISCHQLEVQTHRSKGDFVSSIIGTGNPLDKDGSRPSFIEEARCHVTVSLLIEMSESDPEWEESLPIAIAPMLRQMKMAAGDVLSFREPQVLYLEEGNASKLKILMQRLMLGHVLVERRQLLQDYVNQNPEQDVLHALLAHLHIRHRVAVDANQEAIAIGNNQYLWEASRLQAGWLVPIAVGFQGISPLGLAQNQRDANTPHRFAESVLTLGEFVMPYRIERIDDMLWHYHVDAEQDLYVCQTSVASLEN